MSKVKNWFSHFFEDLKNLMVEDLKRDWRVVFEET